MRPQITPAVMSINDFSAWARLGRTRIYEEINAGALPSFKIGRRRFIKATDATAWLEEKIGPAANHEERA
jgi:hypothetical protein